MPCLEEVARLARAGLLVWAACGLARPPVAFADGPLLPFYPPTGHDADGSPPARDNAEEERAFAVRLQNRLSGRLSLDLNLGLASFKKQSEAGDPFPVVRFLFGYRKNLTPGWGYHVRGGPMLGTLWRSPSGDTGPYGVQVDTTILTGASADGLLVFGPFGRFFVGPLLCLDYVYVSNTTLDKVEPTVHLHNGVTAGGGFDIGGVFGSQEQLTLYQSLRITAGAGESMLFWLFGIGYLR